MKARYLEVTFKKGRTLAAYLYLPRSIGAKSVRTEALAPGVQVDFGLDGVPIGLEFTDPERVRVDVVNQVLLQIGAPQLDKTELKPLLAA